MGFAVMKKDDWYFYPINFILTWHFLMCMFILYQDVKL